MDDGDLCLPWLEHCRRQVSEPIRCAANRCRYRCQADPATGTVCAGAGAPGGALATPGGAPAGISIAAVRSVRHRLRHGRSSPIEESSHRTTPAFSASLCGGDSTIVGMRALTATAAPHSSLSIKARNYSR